MGTKWIIGIGVAALLLGAIVYRKNEQLNADGNGGNEDTPDILKNWKANLDNKNLSGILNDYSKDAILVATFGKKIKHGHSDIRGYFQRLFQKDNLKVEFSDVHILDKGNLKIVTGNYIFKYTEGLTLKQIKARYSFIFENGKIIKHHSSEMPQ